MLKCRTMAGGRVGLVMALLAGVNGAAVGAMVTFSVAGEGEARRATVALVEVEGIPHVSLDTLVRQLGGECTISPASVRVDYGGKSARVGVNDTAVEASLRRFSLGRPLLRQGDDVLMAYTDVDAFFRQGFNVGLMRQPVSAARGGNALREGRVEREELGEPAAREEWAEAEEMLSLPAQTGRPNVVVRSVIVDAGHGGSDSGCRGRSLVEKDLALALAQKMKALAEESGRLTVVLTRDGDQDKPTRSRVNLAKLRRVDLFISLHAGAGMSSAAHGFELFCQKPKGSGKIGTERSMATASYHVATAVAEGLTQATSAASRGIHRVNCRVLDELPMPGVLVEVGCLTNPSEEELLQTEAYQTRLAQGILAGIGAFVPAAPEQGPQGLGAQGVGAEGQGADS